MSETTETIVSSEDVPFSKVTGELKNIQAAYRLTGKNYLKWSQVVRTFLKGKGMLRHLLGTGPKSDDPSFDAWDQEDSMVMSWLWNSMSPEISDTCIFLTTAKDIWEAVRQTYSKVRDAAQVYEIKIKTSATKQGSRSVTEYANVLQSLWQELDHYRCIRMKCSDDAAILKNFIEKDRVYDFLAGLNVEFDQVRVQILGKEDLPSLNEAISLIRAEESRRGVMLDIQPLSGSALISANTNSKDLKSAAPESQSGTEKRRADMSRTTNNKDNIWCTYCKKPRHTRDQCWKLYGKPQTSSKERGFKGNKVMQI